jgi:hypothetical protein
MAKNLMEFENTSARFDEKNIKKVKQSIPLTLIAIFWAIVFAICLLESLRPSYETTWF